MHNIENIDRGYVWGDTWHRLEQYQRLQRPVTLNEALQVFDYPIEILPSQIVWSDGSVSDDVGSYKIGRPDHKMILNSKVTNQYTMFDMQNAALYMSQQLAEAHSYDGHPVEIESVGTLKSGAIRFLSMVVDRQQIHGDDSPTNTRIMITDDLTGRNGVAGVFSTVRTVCDNTRGFAISQAKATDGYFSERHNAEVNNLILSRLTDMAEIKLKSRNEKLRLDALATYGNMSFSLQKQLLDILYPVTYDDDNNITKRSRRKEAHTHVKELMAYGQEGIHPSYSKTPYAFFNAITNYEARKNGRKSSQEETDAEQSMRVSYDNVFGNSAKHKEHALTTIENYTVNA